MLHEGAINTTHDAAKQLQKSRMAADVSRTTSEPQAIQLKTNQRRN